MLLSFLSYYNSTSSRQHHLHKNKHRSKIRGDTSIIAEKPDMYAWRKNGEVGRMPPSNIRYWTKLLLLSFILVLSFACIFYNLMLLRNKEPSSSSSRHIKEYFETNTSALAIRSFQEIWVLLGAPVTAHATPGPDMKERLDRCIQMFHNREGSQQYLGIVLSGGSPATYGSSGVAAEAVVMARYLVGHGNIPKENLILETRAQHIFHNALYTKHILQSGGSPANEITIITHDWHMRRSLWCFEIVWSDSSPRTIFHTEAVESPTKTDLQTKHESEQRILQNGWIPRCIQEEAFSPSMPPTEIAMAKWNDLFLDGVNQPSAGI